VLIAIIMHIVFVISNAYLCYGDAFVSRYMQKWQKITEGKLNNRELRELILDMYGKGSMTLFYRYMTIALSAILIVQLLGLLISYPFENRKISKILRPINEIALRADELSRMTFADEDKYRVIEDALDNIEPGEDDKLSFNNSDLKGVEAAMNNLLTRMRESYRQQARFVNDASHELRTPIAVIEGYANMLKRWGKDDEKVLEESITAISHESEHMKHLVEQLLFLARGDSGKTVLELKETSLNSLMQETYEESLMIDEDHPYRFKGADEDIIVQADEGMLKQAVRILIDNAAKYTKTGDEIILSVGRTENGQPYLRVQDSGIGMAENDMEHMFERFYRADEARNTQGTGLGLSIAKWIVDKHKGHFEITSVTGLGTRISIVL
ncbi:MAG: HAMP domain-containing histidine kinase, partial [Lachnospiraceae bacterium]|nr:HAMP domain-containing histidine kinase [Lachnospiraceae bacterium]